MTTTKRQRYGGILSAAAFALFFSGCGNRSEPAATAPPTTSAPSAAGAPAGAPPANAGGMQQVRPGMAGVPK